MLSQFIHAISLKGASGRFPVHFNEVYEKYIEYTRVSRETVTLAKKILPSGVFWGVWECKPVWDKG